MEKNLLVKFNELLQKKKILKKIEVSSEMIDNEYIYKTRIDIKDNVYIFDNKINEWKEYVDQGKIFIGKGETEKEAKLNAIYKIIKNEPKLKKNYEEKIKFGKLKIEQPKDILSQLNDFFTKYHMDKTIECIKKDDKYICEAILNIDYAPYIITETYNSEGNTEKEAKRMLAREILDTSIFSTLNISQKEIEEKFKKMPESEDDAIAHLIELSHHIPYETESGIVYETIPTFPHEDVKSIPQKNMSNVNIELDIFSVAFEKLKSKYSNLDIEKFSKCVEKIKNKYNESIVFSIIYNMSIELEFIPNDDKTFKIIGNVNKYSSILDKYCDNFTCGHRHKNILKKELSHITIKDKTF